VVALPGAVAEDIGRGQNSSGGASDEDGRGGEDIQPVGISQGFTEVYGTLVWKLRVAQEAEENTQELRR